MPRYSRRLIKELAVGTEAKAEVQSTNLGLPGRGERLGFRNPRSMLCRGQCIPYGGPLPPQFKGKQPLLTGARAVALRVPWLLRAQVSCPEADWHLEHVKGDFCTCVTGGLAVLAYDTEAA